MCREPRYLRIQISRLPEDYLVFRYDEPIRIGELILWVLYFCNCSFRVGNAEDFLNISVYPSTNPTTVS